jgi:hypothetical protein
MQVYKNGCKSVHETAEENNKEKAENKRIGFSGVPNFSHF